MKTAELKSLSNEELLRRLSEVLHRTRRIESELIAHIAEVDARRLYAEEAYPSMFLYCVQELHLSEAEAYLGIEVARASRKYPDLLTMLEDGDLHVSGLELLARHLDELDSEKRKSVLARAKHKTKRQIQELIAELAPKPDVPPAIRKLPDRKRKATKPSTSVDTQLGPDPVAPGTKAEPKKDDAEPAKSQAEDHKRAPSDPLSVEPLSPARYKIQFTAGAELKEKIERLAALMPNADLAAVIEAAVTEKLERAEAKRYGKVKNPRKSVEDADAAPDSREPAAAVKRAVCERDGGQCTYVSAAGKRCPVLDGLEFHHLHPYAKGGGATVQNLTLRCRTHNVYAAELDFGVDHMRRYRRGADRVGEPAPGWQLGPERSVRQVSASGVGPSRFWVRASGARVPCLRRSATPD